MKQAQQSVQLIDYMGSDLSVCNAARVSFNKESSWEKGGQHKDGYWDNELFSLSEKDQKLIAYLAKHNHWSPFAHNSLTFRIKAPIFVCRQLSKHQVGGTINEVSRRYVDDEPEFYLPEAWRGKPVNAKQGSDGVIEDQSVRVKLAIEYALATYQNMLEDGSAPEEARMVLPLNTMTEWWWTGSLMFFARVCKQRLDLHAQNATREVASLIAAAIPSEFSCSWKALMGQSN